MVEEAEQLLQKALEINSRHSPTLIDLGTAYARMGDEWLPWAILKMR
jgi:Flp pilus assembly protein TadD